MGTVSAIKAASSTATMRKAMQSSTVNMLEMIHAR
jgi:hypothetical protein